MPHTPDHTRRLLRELEPHLPDAADQVLERECYHDPGFCDRFLDYTEDLIFRRPEEGLQVARTLPRLVRIILGDSEPRERESNLARMVRALGLLGTAYRSVGRLAEAEKRYEAALVICKREKIPLTTKGDLYVRWATLRNTQGRFAEAHRLIDKALAIFELEGAEECIAMALATRAVAHILARRFSEAVHSLSKVLGGRKLTPRVELSVTGNLALAVLSLDDSQALDDALKHLLKARQLAGPRQSVQKSRIYWIEAMASIRRGRTDDGERRYRKALAGFRKFGAVYEEALVALDLSALLRFAGRWLELEELAAETFARFQELAADVEALAALKLWLEAGRERQLNEELLGDVKARLEEQARRQPPRAVRRAGS